MPRVFISYVQDESAVFVHWLATYLDQLPEGDIRAWYDRDITPASGRGWSVQLEGEIDAADFVLVILSRSTIASEFIGKEIAYAQARNKKIIPVLLEACDIPITLSDLHYVNFTGDHDVAVSKLIHYLKGSPLPGASANEPPASVLAAYHQYLRLLVHRLGALPLSVIDPLNEEELPLSRLWTPLSTTATEELGDEGLSYRFKGDAISVLSAVSRESRLVLMGDPGAGKSTAARYVTLCLAGAELRDPAILNLGLGDLEEWKSGRLCPIYMDLREYAARGMPESGATGADLLRFIVSGMRRAFPALVHDLLRRLEAGLCLVVLDGMDEVPQARRRRAGVLESLRGFAAQFPGCRFLVTTRTYAYRRGDWRLDNFAEAEIAPFDAAQINTYVEQWYSIIVSQRPDLAGRQIGLQSALAARADLGYLAKRPLLLALMASIHSRNNGFLPGSRAELYREITHLLLVHWESSKNVLNPKTGETQSSPSSLAQFLGHGIRQVDLQAALCSIAFDAQQSMDLNAEDADITIERLALVLHRALANDPTADLVPNAFGLVEELRDRSGIVVAQDEDLFRFPHRTFQEYMAACHLCSDPHFPEELAVLVRLDPERWREVIIFAIGEVIPPGVPRYNQVWELIQELVDEEPPEEGQLDTLDPRWSAALFAGLGVTTNGVPSPSRKAQRAVYARLGGWLERLVTEGALHPRDRAAAGIALATGFGDARIGVGLEEGLPQIQWTAEISGGQVDLGEDHEPTRASIGGYRLAVFPVTNMQYQAFVEAEDGAANADWWAFSLDAYEWRLTKDLEYFTDVAWPEPSCPRVGVCWYEAVAFCCWLSSKPGFGGARLPTEAEWEHASRGSDSLLFPWGNDFAAMNANLSGGDVGSPSGVGRTSPVGMYPSGRSPFGVEDAVGNVWEWCQTEFRSMYQDASDGRESVEGSQPRVLRGGSWRTPASGPRARLTQRGRLSPSDRSNEVGFRVCLPN